MIKILLRVTLLLILLSACQSKPPENFDGQNAFEYAKQQVDFGPRIPGSEAHAKTVELIKQELTSFNWTVEIQSEIESVM